MKRSISRTPSPSSSRSSSRAGSQQRPSSSRRALIMSLVQDMVEPEIRPLPFIWRPPQQVVDVAVHAAAIPRPASVQPQQEVVDVAVHAAAIPRPASVQPPQEVDAPAVGVAEPPIPRLALVQSPLGCVEGLEVHVTPRGSYRVTGAKVGVVASPRGQHLRRDGAKVPLSAMETVERDGINDEEYEELDLVDPVYTKRWLNKVATSGLTAEERQEVTAGVSGLQAYSSHSSVLPSTSATTVARGEQNEGSDLDSDIDDDIISVPVEGVFARDIPGDEEIDDEPIRETVRAIETDMDREIDRLIGTSTSFEWVANFDAFQGRRHEFTGPAPGPVKDYDTPYDAFTDIWGEDFIKLIALETNRYAKQTIETRTAKGQLSVQSRLHRWTDTNADEVYRLFAVYMLMGICQRTSQDEYWKTNYYLDMPKFRDIMSYNRYLLMNKFLHFVDNLDASPNLRQSDGFMLSKKVLKLAPVIMHLNSKFTSLYNLAPEICIDESLTLFKGRLSWVQSIRSKAARFGIKSYELCESKSGYLYKFQLYAGKNSESSSTEAVSSNLGGESTQIVLDLLQGLEQRGHHLTMDNFYNCPALSRYLKSSLGFDSLGTLRASRKNVPPAISKVPKNVAKGTIVARHCGDVSIVAWKDSKVVNIISTYHTDETYMGSQAGKVLEKPVCVRDYNRTMGGVDLMDQKLSMYLVERKRGVKWYMKMFKRLLNISIHNAFVLYTSSLQRRNMPIMTHRTFRYELADLLIKRHGHEISREVSQPVTVCSRLNKNITHVPRLYRSRDKRGRCVVCYRQDKIKKVCSQCRQCNAFLCFDNCWYEWHNLTELKVGERASRKRTRRT